MEPTKDSLLKEDGLPGLSPPPNSSPPPLDGTLKTRRGDARVQRVPLLPGGGDSAQHRRPRGAAHNAALGAEFERKTERPQRKAGVVGMRLNEPVEFL